MNRLKYEIQNWMQSEARTRIETSRIKHTVSETRSSQQSYVPILNFIYGG